MRFTAYMTEADEPPLWDFIAKTGARLVRIFSPVWPPALLAAAPKTEAEDECLAIWYPEVFAEQEFLLTDCQPEVGPHGCYVAWELPLITCQRQWYWRKQATIFAMEKNYRAFRPQRDEDFVFAAEEIVDFEYQLVQLRQRVRAIRDWLGARCYRFGSDCFAANGALTASLELQQIQARHQEKQSV